MTSYRIAVVCLGNICRSPVAEKVLGSGLAAAGLDGEITVESAGTAAYHLGKPMDPRAAAALERAGYDPSGHRARQFTADWFTRFDTVLAMDAENLADLTDLARSVNTDVPIRMFRSFDPEVDPGRGDDLDVPDPYYGGASDFDETVRTAERTCSRIVMILTKSGAL